MAEEKKDIGQAAQTAISSVDFYVQTSPVYDQIAIDTIKAEKSSAEIVSLFAAFLGAASTSSKLEPIQAKGDATPLQMESIASTKSRAFDIAKIAAILPFLLDKDARDYIGSFIQGLVGAETLDKITTALKIVGGVLVGVFAVKLFKQVSDTISTFVRLSQVVGVLFGLTQENNDLEVDDARQTEKEKWEKRKEKFEKNKSEHRRKRLKKLEQARKIRKVFKTLKSFAKFTGIGFIVGAAVDAFVDSTFDYFEKDSTEQDPVFPDEDQDTPSVEELEAVDSSSFVGNIFKKFISNLTFGVISEEMLDKILGAISRLINGKGNQPDLKTATIAGQEVQYDALGNVISGTPVPAAVPEKKEAVVMRKEPKAPPPAAITTTSTTGLNLTTSSESVAGAKKDLSTGSTVVNNIDASKVIVTDTETNRDYGSTNYSAAVGR